MIECAGNNISLSTVSYQQLNYLIQFMNAATLPDFFSKINLRVLPSSFDETKCYRGIKKSNTVMLCTVLHY